MVHNTPKSQLTFYQPLDWSIRTKLSVTNLISKRQWVMSNVRATVNNIDWKVFSLSSTIQFMTILAHHLEVKKVFRYHSSPTQTVSEEDNGVHFRWPWSAFTDVLVGFLSLLVGVALNRSSWPSVIPQNMIPWMTAIIILNMLITQIPFQ